MQVFDPEGPFRIPVALEFVTDYPVPVPLSFASHTSILIPWDLTRVDNHLMGGKEDDRARFLSAAPTDRARSMT